MSANGNRPDAIVEPRPAEMPDPTAERRERTRRFRRRATGRDAAGRDAGADASAGASVQMLQAELMLLREENARLAQERHQPPGVAGLLRQAGAGRAPEPIVEDSADELTQLVTDYAVMRESLLLACEAMESSLAALRGRLVALPAALAPAEPLAASNGNGPAAVAAARVAIDGSALP